MFAAVLWGEGRGPDEFGCIIPDFWRRGRGAGAASVFNLNIFRNRDMTKRFAVALIAGATLLLAAGCSEMESTPGGYMGNNAGHVLKPADAAESDMKTGSPTMWCRAASVEPGRCMSRAAADHAYCLGHDPDHYAACRRAMDFIGWHN
jgi:hypothetical protein